ncbi:hypothetical protein GOODEAATRI_015831 [Goodea atripinnis]|uniref:Transmembrane protein n=1 Tax=Goodea atripinnis TaxID=208336 RepID=A0ABV0NKP1_9TELE
MHDMHSKQFFFANILLSFVKVSKLVKVIKRSRKRSRKSLTAETLNIKSMCMKMKRPLKTLFMFCLPLSVSVTLFVPLISPPPCKARMGAEGSEGRGCSAKCEGDMYRLIGQGNLLTWG